MDATNTTKTRIINTTIASLDALWHEANPFDGEMECLLEAIISEANGTIITLAENWDNLDIKDITPDWNNPVDVEFVSSAMSEGSRQWLMANSVEVGRYE